MFGVEAAVGALNLIWTGVLAQRTTRQVAPESGPYEQLRRKTIRFTAGQVRECAERSQLLVQYRSARRRRAATAWSAGD